MLFRSYVFSYTYSFLQISDWYSQSKNSSYDDILFNQPSNNRTIVIFKPINPVKQKPLVRIMESSDKLRHILFYLCSGTKYTIMKFKQLQKSIILSKLEIALISPHRYHITTVHHARYLFILII